MLKKIKPGLQALFWQHVDCNHFPIKKVPFTGITGSKVTVNATVGNFCSHTADLTMHKTHRYV
jgi:hypothetical protein